MRAFLLAALALMWAAAAKAEPTAESAAAWRTLTRVDLQAAYDLLKSNHPAAAPEAGDPAFVARLDAVYAKGLSRLPAVSGLNGYAALLGEFAHGLGDGHISFGLNLLPRTRGWAGIILAKRGADWVVAADEPKIVGRELKGARLVDCDGRTPDQLAREVLPFHSNAAVDAEQVISAAWLLLDDDNPFARRPERCAFEQAGAPVAVTLAWSRIADGPLRQTYWKTPAGAAAFGVRAVGEGYWVGFGRLDPAAQPTLDAVTAQAGTIRRARFVVVDLRGNGGGDDLYGRALAEALYGPAYVEAVLGPRENAGGCRSVFRASDGNASALAAMARVMARRGDAEGARLYDEAVAGIKAAQARGQALTGAPRCAAVFHPIADAGRRSLDHQQVLVLTDAACFSSCISTVDVFRRLGAVQIGQPTSADTHYSEVRAETLPSGLAQVSTLQAIITDAPASIGPFAPRVVFDGDITDIGALEAWVTGPVLAAVTGGEARGR